MARSSNPPPAGRTGTSVWTWVVIAAVVLIAGAIIWWVVADLVVGDEQAAEEIGPVDDPEDDVDAIITEDEGEEEEGTYRFHPDRSLVFTLDGVDIVIAA